MEILKITRENFKEIIKIVTKSIKKGKVIIFPTDTVYGFLCDATNKKAVQKIFKIKKRSFKKPIPIFVKDIKMAKNLAIISKKQEKLLKKYWPGKVTVRLKRKTGKKLYGVGENAIALRISKYKLLNNLVENLNFPLAQTSVNFSGELTITSAKEALRIFSKIKTKPDLIIDGGKLKSKPSKIIDLTINPPKILRP